LDLYHIFFVVVFDVATEVFPIIYDIASNSKAIVFLQL
jgi:hypothetical protein